ncbi:MAG: ribosome biogenesis GTPase Der [Cyanobacteria bacterium P01_H01_bin.121]
MPLPTVAIIGRPNVGKSTLVNRLVGGQEAIVYNQPGVTRDRTYQPSFWRDRDFQVVDTGGLVFDDDTEFLPLIREQVELALVDAQAAIFVVDGQAGLTASDTAIATWLRQQSVPVVLAVNKCESPDQGNAQAAEFWALGLGEPLPISSIHGSGTGDLLDQVIEHFPPIDQIAELEEIRVAIVGRPNVGKSSLLNAFVGSDRSIVSPISGTTRDAIDSLVERGDTQYRLVDTAGIRRKKNVNYGPEFFGINRAFKAIRRADVVLLVVDALDGVTEQDQKLANRVEDEGRACIIVANKWDAVAKDSVTIYQYEREFRNRLYFLDWANMIFVSALTGQRVQRILDLVDAAAEQHRRRVTTSVVNEVLEDALAWRSPPANRQGRQGRIYYGTQVSSRPPSFTLFVNDPQLFQDSYRRYVERQIREGLGFQGSPIRLFWRGKKERDVERTLNRATRVKH